MKRRVLALLIVSVALTACESNPTESDNNGPKLSPTVQASPTPATVPSPGGSPAATSQIKPGDKVKAVNGTFNDATVVSVDEKLGRVTVKIQGQTGERTVALTEVTKQ